MKLQVLMIDDNLGDLQLIEAAFTDCRIPVAFRGVAELHTALELLAQATTAGMPAPDVIILDLSLLAMAGKEAVVAIRDSVLARSIPLVVFSGTAHGRIVADCLAAGAVEVIPKPASYKGYLSFVTQLAAQRTPHGSRSRLRPRPAAAGIGITRAPPIASPEMTKHA